MKVCIGLSGGVDSSVAALLLKQAGYDVFALFMQNWHDASTTLHGDCEWEEDRFVAELVARKIGIPFYFVDLSKEYRARVVDYMFEEYSKGRTPNPDVLCNREIKFSSFWEAAKKLGADMVATGHYCRKSEDTLEDGTKLYHIYQGSDPNKDQSYFLCQLTQEQLSTALFPIGDIPKPEVRRIAKEADLPSADKKDSQGICFVGKVDLPTFLKQKLQSRVGNVVEVFDEYYTSSKQYNEQKRVLSSVLSEGARLKMITDYISEDKSSSNVGVDKSVYAGTDGGTGKLSDEKACPWDLGKLLKLSDEDLMIISSPLSYTDIKFETETYRSGKKKIKKTRYKDNPYAKVVGEHEGAHFYTIGQRKGLNIGGHKDSIFVIETDTETNTIYVGEGHRHKGLSRSCLRIHNSELHWIRPDLRMQTGDIKRYKLRIRYRQPLQNATLIQRDEYLFILFDEPQRGITSGQFAVWYTDDEEMIGSGVI